MKDLRRKSPKIWSDELGPAAAFVNSASIQPLASWERWVKRVRSPRPRSKYRSLCLLRVCQRLLQNSNAKLVFIAKMLFFCDELGPVTLRQS